MDHTAISSAPGQVAATPDVPVRRPRSVEQPLWYQAIAAIASLRVTVVLFVPSFVLIFFATLAQIDSGSRGGRDAPFDGRVDVCVRLHGRRQHADLPQDHQHQPDDDVNQQRQPTHPRLAEEPGPLGVPLQPEHPGQGPQSDEQGDQE